MDLKADDKGDGEKSQPSGNDCVINLQEVKNLQGIVNPSPSGQPPSTPKLGAKQGSAHFDGSHSSDSSGEDLNAKSIKNKKKGVMPTKAVWAQEDIDVILQYRYKTDVSAKQGQSRQPGHHQH